MDKVRVTSGRTVTYLDNMACGVMFGARSYTGEP